MKILFLQKRLLFPTDTGGKIRSLNVLRHLAHWHDVTYLCNLQPHESEQIEQMRSVGVDLITLPWREAPRRSVRFAAAAVRNLGSPTPLNVDKDYDPRLRSVAQRLVESGRHDLLVCDFVQMARNCLGFQLPKVLFQHNVEAEIFERLAASNRGWRGRYYRYQASKMARFEGAAGRDFARVVAVSQRDRQQFIRRYRWPHVDVIDTAVDTAFFRPDSGPHSEPRDAPHSVVFVGSMDWQPNIEGVQHFVNAIWPHVRDRNQAATFTIVGRNPPPAIRRLETIPGVRVTGTVADTRPFLRSAVASVVPLYCGGGTRLKIFEAMAMRCPVISTSLGAEGLDLVNDEHLLIRDRDESFADAICHLLSHRTVRQRIAQSGYDLVQSRYTSERVARQFEQCCLRAAQPSRPLHTADVESP